MPLLDDHGTEFANGKFSDQDVPRRAAAAFFADSLRSSFVIELARAYPPLNPPTRPSMTAAFLSPSVCGIGSPQMGCMMASVIVASSPDRATDLVRMAALE